MMAEHIDKHFIAAWAEWVKDHPAIKEEIDLPLLNSIAGYFYFQGATNAIRDARLALDETAAEVGAKK